jgi:nucleoside-diphosphate-sugar epimerase
LKLAVTGASGFIGRHFVAAALADGHQVRALVRSVETLSTDVERVHGELSSSEARREMLRDADVFVHLAGAGVRRGDRGWANALDVNVRLSAACVEDAADAVRSHSIFIGTCLEYRGFGVLPTDPWPSGVPLCAEDAPLEVAGAYAASKAAGGLVLRALAREKGHPCWYLRLATTYGPGDHPEKVLSAGFAAVQARCEFRATLGEQIRDWLWVGDAVKAILRACHVAPPRPGFPCNVGTGAGVPLKDALRTLFVTAGGDESLLSFGAIPYGRCEPHVLVLNTECATTALGALAPRPIEDGFGEWLRQAGDNKTA